MCIFWIIILLFFITCFVKLNFKTRILFTQLVSFVLKVLIKSYRDHFCCFKEKEKYITTKPKYIFNY